METLGNPLDYPFGSQMSEHVLGASGKDGLTFSLSSWLNLW